MHKKQTISEENLRLAAAYSLLTDKGRDVLDVVTQKLAEINLAPDEANYKSSFYKLGEQKND